MKDLSAADSRISSEWQDAKIREIEGTFLEPLEPHVRATLLAIAELAELLAQADRACGSDLG
jgi:hypothetical protein